MTKQSRNERKRSCKTSCLVCTFFSICKLLLDKKRKNKKENCCHSGKFFPFQMKCFLIFAEVFTRNSSQKLLFAKVFVKNFAIFWSYKSFCWRKFLRLKYLYALFFISDHLQESLLFMRNFLNLFFFMITLLYPRKPLPLWK